MKSQPMKPSSSSSILLFSLTVSVLLFRTEAVLMKKPGNNTIPAVIMFGDSIVDTGNINNRKTLAKSNFPPYGRNANWQIFKWEGPGRLMEELGIKEFLPPYLQPNLPLEEIPTGVSFASGGCGYDSLTSKLVAAISLSDQLRLFKEYTQKLREIVGDERRDTILKAGLFVVVASSNDIANTYFGFRIRKIGYDIPAYTDLLAVSASTFLKELYGLRVQRIGVLGAPPLGCLPSSRTMTLGGGTAGKDCAENYNQAAELFNAKLSAQIDSLNSNLPDARIVYMDIYNPLLDLIQNPNKFGVEIVKKGCCGTGTIEAAILCSPLSLNTCKNLSPYLFRDSYHPTEKAYKILVSDLLKKYLNNFF